MRRLMFVPLVLAAALVPVLGGRSELGQGSASAAGAPGSRAVAASPARAVTATALPLSASAVIEPLDSVSCGSANRGGLADARALPVEGAGFVVPDPWRSRNHRFGTDELVGLIERAAARVEREHPGGRLAVADLSAETGGALRGHRSHQSGRDGDLIYYALDERGAPFPPDHRMASYRSDGMATYAESPAWERTIPPRWFDLARNWALVRAMIEDPQAQVTRVFVSRRVRRWMLSYATTAGESAELIRRAERLLAKPDDVGGHNDHMHVRVACGDDDRTLGRCDDDGAPRRRRGRWTRMVRCPDPTAVELARQ